MSINGLQRGTRFGQLYLPKDEWNDDNTTGGTATRTYRALYADWRNTAPALGSRHPLSTFHILKTRRAAQLETNPLLCDVTLDYAWEIAAAPSGSFAQPPEDLLDENGSTVEVPIEQHPNFHDDDTFVLDEQIYVNAETGLVCDWDDPKAKFVGFKTDSKWFGVTKFLVGTKTVTITQFGLSQFAPVDDQLGKLSDPAHGLGNNGKWLLITGHRGKQGIYYTLSLVYLFSALGFIDGEYDY